MRQYDIIIIGSGLGGLECGYILSKKGYNVCVLEKNAQVGGCLQTFRRGKTVFDTGFHFVGGLDEGQSLHTLFRYFDLLGLPWQRMDGLFAEVVIDGHSYHIASGYEKFIETLAEDFPHQKQALQTYASFLKQTGEDIGKGFLRREGKSPLFEQSAYSFLQETIEDPLLREVLSGGSLTMELCAGKLPLYVFAQINNSFIQSAWRLKGGGSQIAAKLAGDIRKMGGTILTQTEATRLIENENGVCAVEYNNEEQIQGRYIISNLHPVKTLSLIPESRFIRRIYRNRINSLANTYGMFTLHLELKENSLPYLNKSIYIHKAEDLWDCSHRPGSGVTSAMLNYQIPGDGSRFAGNIDILTPMHWEEVAEWAGTTVEKRGDAYKAFKREKAEECLRFVAERMPGLENSISRFHTTTPLTYRDYTGTWQGAAYGIQKDCNRILQTLLTPQTQIPNLFLTGQNLNVHGILGVSITSFFTCAKITGIESLAKDFED